MRPLLAPARAAALLLLAAFIGCADPVQPPRTSTASTTTPVSTPSATTTTGTMTTSPLVDAGSDGASYGGRQPITGAHVYLFAANTTAWGAPSISLLNPAAPGVKTDAAGAYVTTNSSGNFNLTGAYQCTPGDQAYVYGAGGNPGLPPEPSTPPSPSSPSSEPAPPTEPSPATSPASS